MPGYPIQIRRITDPNNLTDFLYPSEIVLDTVGKRLCVHTGGSLICYPSIDVAAGQFTLEASNLLYSYDSKKCLDWSLVDGLEVYSPTLAATLSLSGQTMKLAPDARINRGGVQSLETFFVNPSSSSLPITYTATEYDLSNGGNVYLHVERSSLNADKYVWLGSAVNYDHLKGIRNLNSDSRSHNLLREGAVTLVGTSSDPYFTGAHIRSHVNYPDAANMKLTVYLTYETEQVNTTFSTRIGYAKNWQHVNTQVLTLGKKRGAVVLWYNPAKTLASNTSKPLTIDWVYDLISAGNAGMVVDRRLSISCMSVFPGWLTADEITPSFAERGMSRIESLMYDTGIRTKSCIGREYHFVNFEYPMVGNYTVNVTNNGYPVQITDKKPTGFTVRSIVAPINSVWSFNYQAVCR